eukprot:TCALIF_13571-PA protein Name:"Similar to CG32809 Coiled-coil domain-containing protein CG32809 (Drosophila melanogaster)" AED:0.27 eAED:0.38 QI:0/0/0/0.66/1/1/3/0/1219
MLRLGKSNQSSKATGSAPSDHNQRQSLEEPLEKVSDSCLSIEIGARLNECGPNNNNNIKITSISRGDAGGGGKTVDWSQTEEFSPEIPSKMMRPSSRALGEVLISDRPRRTSSQAPTDRPPSRGTSMERPSSRMSGNNPHLPTPERPSSRNSNSGRTRQPRLGISTGPYLFDDDPGIMSEVETSSTRFRRPSGGVGKSNNNSNSNNKHNNAHSSSNSSASSVPFGKGGGRARSASNASSRTVTIRASPSPLFSEDDPGIMSEAETSSTARSKRGNRVRNSIPMGSLTLNRHQQQLSKSQQGHLRLPNRRHQAYQSSTMFEEDPGIMSEAETASTSSKRRRHGTKTTLPVVRTPSKTLERPLGLVFLIYRGDTKRALLPNEITSVDTVKALFVRSFNKILTMDYMDSPRVKLYIHDGAKDIFYELEKLNEIRDRTILKVFEADSSGRGPAGLGPSGLPPITNTDEYNAASEAATVHIPGLMPDPEYVDAQYVVSNKMRQKSNASTLPRNAFSSLDPASNGILPVVSIGSRTGLSGSEITLPSAPRSYSSSSSSNGPSVSGTGNSGTSALGERSKTLGPGFMRGHHPHSRLNDQSLNGTKRVESGYVSSPDGNYDFSFVESKPSRFSSQPRGRYYPGPANTEEAKARMMNMEAQLSQLTGMVEKALKHKKLGKKQVSFDRTVSYSDEKPPQGILVTSKRNNNNNSLVNGQSGSSNSSSSNMTCITNTSSSHNIPTSMHDIASGKAHQQFFNPQRVCLTDNEFQGHLKRLHRTTKDLKQEVRVLRRLTQLQSMAMKDLVQDTYLKLREACVSFSSHNGLMSSAEDLELWRIANDEELFSRELNELLQKIAALESQVEEVRSGVINKKNKIMLQDVESMALILSQCSKTVTQLRQAYPTLETNLKSSLDSTSKGCVGSREPIVVAEFLKKSLDRIDSAWRRSKKLTGTLVTLKRLASVQEQRFHPGSNSSINDISLSPPPSELSRAASISSNRESTLDDLLDALQTYSIPSPSPSPKPSMGLLNSNHNPPATPLQTAKVRPQSHLPSLEEPPITSSSLASSPAKKIPSSTLSSGDQKPPCPPPRLPTSDVRPPGLHGKNPPPPPPRTISNGYGGSGNNASSQGLHQTRSSSVSGGSSGNGGERQDPGGQEDVLDTRHQELITRQRQLQEQYQRLQEMQKKSKVGNGAASSSSLVPSNGAIPHKKPSHETQEESNSNGTSEMTT